MLTSFMMSALRAVRDGGNLTKSQHYYLMYFDYINRDNTLTMKGHNELNNDDNQKEDNENL